MPMPGGGGYVLAEFVVAEFYALQTLELLAKADQFKRSHEKWLRDFHEYKRLFENKFANALFDYTALVVYGELRHSRRRCGLHHPNIPQGGPRSGSYVEAEKYSPAFIAEAGLLLFYEYEWETAYGGERWGAIAKALHRRVNKLNHFDNDVVFIDHCVDLSHNSSHYLDKPESDIFYTSCKSAYTGILNNKAEADDPVWLLGYLTLSHRLHKLTIRGVNLGILPEDTPQEKASDSRDNHVERLLGYRSIEWGEKYPEVSPQVLVEYEEEEEEPNKYAPTPHLLVECPDNHYCGDSNMVSEWNNATLEIVPDITPLEAHNSGDCWYLCPSCGEQFDGCDLDIEEVDEEDVPHVTTANELMKEYHQIFDEEGGSDDGEDFEDGSYNGYSEEKGGLLEYEHECSVERKEEEKGQEAKKYKAPGW